MGLGDRIRKKRTDLGLSQTQLANKVGYTSRSTVNKIESGARQPTAKDLPKIAEALDTTVDYLLNGIEIERVQLRELSEQSHLFDYVSKLYGSETSNAVHLFSQLTDFQKGKIIGMMENMINENTYK